MFDPYYKWLGIVPKDQPPNHYRLLGLEIFESDLDVIEGAVDRQMGFVRQYQSGEHAAAAAKILNELANARLCLLKPATKAAYDAKLREAQAPAEPEFPDLPFSTDEPTEKRRSPRKSKKSSPKPAGIPQKFLIGGGIPLVIVVVIAMLMFSGGPKAKPVAKTDEPDQIVKTIPDETKPTTDNALWKDSNLGVDPAGDPVDLLKLVDPKRDVDLGEWSQATSGALIARPHSRVFFPVKPPDDYQLKFTIRRPEGADTISFGILMSGRLGNFVLDGWNASSTGLFLDGREASDGNNCTHRRGTLLGTAITNVVLTVHPGHLHVALGGQTILDWHGDPARFSLMWSEVNLETPYVFVANAPYVIESASLIPLKPEANPVRPARLEREVDVIPLIDLDRDMQRGIWNITKGVLYSPDSGGGKIYLPTVVPEEYTLSLTAELPAAHQGDYGLVIGLVAGKSYSQFTSTAGDTGLDGIDGRRWNGNETRLAGPLLKPGTPVRIDCTVLKDRIVIEADGKVQVDWSGDFRRLFIPGEWSLADARRLFLGSNRHLKIRDLKLGPPAERVKSFDNPPPAIGQTIDLLSKIDPARDAYSGTWERDGAAIRCRGDVEVSKLVIPFTVPDEYQFRVRVTRLDGGRVNNDAVAVGLPVGKGKAMCGLDGKSSSSSGITIDPGIHNNRAIGQVIPLGSSKNIVYTVRKSGVDWSCDGTTIIDWRVSPEAIGVDPFWGTPCRRISLMSYSNAFRFEKLELEAIPPTKLPPPPTLPADGKLLPLIDVVRDARRGDWKLNDEGLLSPAIANARLRIPVVPPTKYELSATVERQQPGGHDFAVALVVGGQPCLIPIDGGNQRVAGIDTLDGRHYADGSNPSSRKYESSLFPHGKKVKIRYRVLPDTILVTCDDKEVIRWHGDPRRLSLATAAYPPNYSQTDRESLWLGSYESGFLIRDLELKPLSDDEADKISKSFSGVFPTTLQANVPLASSGPGSSNKPATNTVTDLPKSWLLKRTSNAPALLVTSDLGDQTAAIQMFRQIRLPFELLPDFPAKGFDYSKFSIIVVGTNMMDYWGAAERKHPAAFQPLVDFMNGGGHLIVFNAYNGRNMEHLIPLGIQTGFNHSDTFQAIPGATEIVFDGAEELIPKGNYLKQAGHFIVQKPHVVLLRRGPGSVEGGPAAATLPVGAGRLTYSSVEPGYGDPPGFWLVQGLIRWAARGAPVTKQDLAEAAAVPLTSDETKSGKLVVLDARYGAEDKLINVTPSAVAAAKNGMLVVTVDPSLVGGDPAPNQPKYLHLRCRLNGVEEFQKLAEYQTALLDPRPPTTVTSKDFKLVDARWGMGLYSPTTWTSVVKLLRPLASKNGLNLSREELLKALANVPNADMNQQRALLVQYQFQGREYITVFSTRSNVAVGESPATK